ncbi:hypothetical protein [Leucobacter chromiireducens]|uniref:hypothetical protein n=1 Tax=Leucobacter chromiireducens TaxID=283877 RepID=UPI003F7F59CF
MSNLDRLHRFLDEIVRSGIEFRNYEVVCAATSGDDTAIVLYTWHKSKRVYGRIYRWPDLVAIFDDEACAPEEYASEVIIHDFDSPPGQGQQILYDWTRSLGRAPGDVRWCDAIEDYAGLDPVLYAGPSAAGAGAGAGRRVAE